MEGLVWVGKKVKLYFSDVSAVLVKIGVIVSVDSFFITLKLDKGSTESIPLNRVLRMEELKNGF